MEHVNSYIVEYISIYICIRLGHRFRIHMVYVLWSKVSFKAVNLSKRIPWKNFSKYYLFQRGCLKSFQRWKLYSKVLQSPYVRYTMRIRWWMLDKYGFFVLQPIECFDWIELFAMVFVQFKFLSNERKHIWRNTNTIQMKVVEHCWFYNNPNYTHKYKRWTPSKLFDTIFFFALSI